MSLDQEAFGLLASLAMRQYQSNSVMGFPLRASSKKTNKVESIINDEDVFNFIYESKWESTFRTN